MLILYHCCCNQNLFVAKKAYYRVILVIFLGVFIECDPRLPWRDGVRFNFLQCFWLKSFNASADAL